jgi:vitamin B12 transporter
MSYGSFENASFGVKVNISDKNSSSSTKIFLSQAENNFEYKPVDYHLNPKLKKLKHAAYSSRGLMHEHRIFLSKSRLDLSVWLQENRRELPATLLEARSIKLQSDSKASIAANWNTSFKRSKLSSYNSVINHVQVYYDEIADIHNRLEVVVLQNAMEYKARIKKKMLLSYRISSSYAEATTDNYEGAKSQHFGSQNASLKYFDKKLNWEIGLRSLLAGGGSSLFMPHASVRRVFNKRFQVHLASENTGRLPTLNELYWIPGGNINTVPMNSWKHETGAVFQSKHFSFNQVVYLTDVESYIEWLPNFTGTFVVTQQGFVRAAGSESHLNTLHNIAGIQIQSNWSYNYTRSVKGRDLSKSTPQRIFIPEHTGSFSLQLQYRRAGIRYMHTYTSSRNVSSQGQSQIAAYSLGDVSCSYKITSFVLRARIRNVWKTEYFVLPFRPMPLRHYELSLSYIFNIKE